jgi:hypothetical protein
MGINIEYGNSGEGNKIDAVLEHAQTNQVKTKPSQGRHAIRTLTKKEIDSVDISFRETFS